GTTASAGPSSSTSRWVTRQTARDASAKRPPRPASSMAADLTGLRHGAVTDGSTNSRSHLSTTATISRSEEAAVSVVFGDEMSSVCVIRARSESCSRSSSSHTRITSTPVLSTAATCRSNDGKRASPNRLLNVKSGHQLVHPRGGLDPELLAQQAPEEAALPDRLADVPLRQVDADDGAMGAFAQGLARDGSKTRSESIVEATGVSQTRAERVERA